jgi:hypothetical protein
MEVKAPSFDPWCSMGPVSPSAPLRGLISPTAMGSVARAEERQVKSGQNTSAPSGARSARIFTAGFLGYLITCSVLASKKWMRSGMKLSRIFSCDFVFTVGSTRATIC